MVQQSEDYGQPEEFIYLDYSIQFILFIHQKTLDGEELIGSSQDLFML